MGERTAAGGGKWVEVAPERLTRWLENFGARHGAYGKQGLTVTADDGASAEWRPPPGVPGVETIDELIAAAQQPRRIGLLLARKGAVAAGVADGTELLNSKVDTHYVQGRTAAGGWSQQRFARRRDNQAKAAASDGSAIALRLLIPYVRTMTALVTGGDRAAVDAILADPRLAPLVPLRDEKWLDVPEPRHVVLVAAIAAARAVSILVREPLNDSNGSARE